MPVALIEVSQGHRVQRAVSRKLDLMAAHSLARTALIAKCLVFV
jgi:hypothetical protein